MFINLDELQRLIDAHNAEVAANPLASWYKTGSDLSIAAVAAMPAMLAELRAARELREAVAGTAWLMPASVTVQRERYATMRNALAAYDKAVQNVH